MIEIPTYQKYIGTLNCSPCYKFEDNNKASDIVILPSNSLWK